MYLMHGNRVVAKIKFNLGYISRVEEVYQPKYLPIGTIHSNELICQYLNTWQKDRTIPFNRSSIELYQKYFEGSALEAAQMFGSFSLTDHYWFKEENSEEKWEDLCFQLNGFSSDLSKFFINLISGTTPDEGKIMKVPDATTDGVLPKMWIQENNTYKLVKLGNYNDLDGIHLLSANEVACSRIAELMEINAVRYDDIILPGMHNKACICECFVPTDCEFITLAQVLRASAGQQINLYDYLCKLGYKEPLEDMIRFYFLIHNKDGHLKNCGFIRNADTLKIESFAPLFDNGCSLNYDGLGHLDMSVKPFCENRIEQLSLLSNPGTLPDYENVAEIIKEVYEDFAIPDTYLDNALQDLIETYKLWDKFIEDHFSDENVHK